MKLFVSVICTLIIMTGCSPNPMGGRGLRVIKSPAFKVVCLSQGDTLFASDSIYRYWVPNNASFISGPAHPWVFETTQRERIKVSGDCVVRRHKENKDN